MKYENKEFSGGNVPIKEVARIMKKDAQFIRYALQNNVLPIGIAIKLPDNERYDYYVSPKLLFEYTGYQYREKCD